ncbi:MAG TPA: redoxin family protein [Vicinamibacterales bacterium]|nr:redoxin family protein [Vicinamibacterales bacterium]
MTAADRAWAASACLLTILMAIPAAQPAGSTESKGTPEAKTLLAQAEAALRGAPDYDKGLALLKQAIQADPHFADAYERLESATRQGAIAHANQAKEKTSDAIDRAMADLKKQYAAWAAADPKNAILAWAQGALEDKDWAAAGKFYERAVALDPKFARPYLQLSLIADFAGENQKQVDYLKQAADVDPQDPQYFFYWASAMKSIDPARSIQLLQQVADKYPGTERGAQGLYWAAFETHDLSKKIAIYERLRREFPPAKSGWSESGMSGLLDAYQRVDAAKALALASDLAAEMSSPSDKKTWTDFASYARAVVDARGLIAQSRPADAVALIDKAPRPKYIDTTPLDLLKAQAQAGAGNTAAAYDGLVAVATKTPTDDVNAAITAYGAALGKPAAAIDADLWARLEAGAKPAPDFALPDYPDGRTVRLADYRGKVVLVNFWYPSCGPCRGEFPTLQRVLDKFKDRGFVILALNVYPEEDAFVMPYMTNNHFSFRPLKTDADWAEKNYGARGYPTNALVDAEGRVIFRPGVIRGESEQRTFELQVETLLKHAPPHAAAQ